MSDTTIPIKDSELGHHGRRIIDDGDAGISTVNAEHPDQRAALLAKLGALRLGSAWIDASVGSLSAGQAAGTSLALAANPARAALFVLPNADGRLYFTGGSGADGPYFPLYAGVPRTLTGADCPTGPIYVTGQAVATKLRIAEA